MIAAKLNVTDPDQLEVSKYFVGAAASNMTQERALTMTKDPDVADGVFLIGQENGDFEDENAVSEGELARTLNTESATDNSCATVYGYQVQV